ncbi:MAG: hypothetical protein HKP61_00070 [Dactylosporangium sp.]|nr:hypothetical protein [Dactylosporangium sp.]NNJ59367.1 hypothetical protein [Dactylosporangium sp.]
MTGPRRDTAGRDQQWLLTLLPAFPLVLLVLRLWYLSRQDLAIMLLLVQYVSPLGLVSALLTTLLWVLPVVVLVTRMLGGLLWVSASTEAEARRSRLSLRVPDWVVLFSVALAALTWQMRFLPALLMVSLAVFGLTVRGRHPASARRVQFACVALPIAVAALAYAWLAPAIAAAVREGEPVTVVLLLLPPGLAVFLTGPVPAGAARLVTRWIAYGAGLSAPFLIGAVFLQTPILPTVAVELEPEASGATAHQVLLGHVITVDDQMTTVLDGRGTVRFVRNAEVVSKVLCPDDDQVPFSAVTVHGWPVEQASLAWLGPVRSPAPADPRCQGRPLVP